MRSKEERSMEQLQRVDEDRVAREEAGESDKGWNEGGSKE